MRVFILLLLLGCTACASTPAQIGNHSSDNTERVFDFETELKKEWTWFTDISAKRTDLSYKDYKLAIYIRSFTSGLPTSEPSVFVERNGKWIPVLSAMLCECTLDVTIEGDYLIFWRWEWVNREEGKLKITGIEFVRFDLRNLELIFPMVERSK